MLRKLFHIFGILHGNKHKVEQMRKNKGLRGYI